MKCKVQQLKVNKKSGQVLLEELDGDDIGEESKEEVFKSANTSRKKSGLCYPATV